MKKLTSLILGFVCLTPLVFGGGIVTNTNQSAIWVRTLSRDASTGIDAVYFNPAGLVKLDNGLHFSLNSQTIFQSKDVTDDYQFLKGSPKKYLGDVKAPVFPSVYAAYKTGKFAVSFGFNPVGGGGGAEYDAGLPAFETRVADLVPILRGSLAALDAGFSNPPPAGYGFDPMFRNVTGYNADIYFKGTSVFFGYQLGLSYEIFDMLSVYGGLRYVTAKNTYSGYVKDVTIDADPADANPVYNIPAAGTYTPGDYMRAVAGATGMPAGTILVLNGYAAAFDAQTADIEADAEEKGSGYTPILGANVALGDKLNIGLKYEFKTTLELTQSVNEGKDGAGMFVQDSTVHSDMPAMISAGVSYRILPSLSATAGFHYFFDKNANYGKTLDATGEQVGNDKVMDKNYFEVSAALEYNITEKLVVSGGYLMGRTGVTEDYQSELSYSLNSNTFGIGAGYHITDNLMVNLGGAFTVYKDGGKDYTHVIPMVLTEVPAKQSYYKDNLFFGIGVDISL